MITAADIISTVRRDPDVPVMGLWQAGGSSAPAIAGDVWNIALGNDPQQEEARLGDLLGEGALFHFPVDSPGHGLSLLHDLLRALAHEPVMVTAESRYVDEEKPLYLVVHVKRVSSEAGAGQEM